MTQTTVAPVVREITVAAPIDTCFTTFVDRFETWWPTEHHIGDGTPKTFVIERAVGGRVYNEFDDGRICQWGTVLEFDEPHKLVYAWHIQGDWTTIDTDLSRSSEVSISFDAIDADHTKVRLEHGALERHGDTVDGLRNGISGDGGWTILLGRFADVTEGRPPRGLAGAIE